MRIDVPISEAWAAVCNQYRAALPYDTSTYHVQIYLGYQHALQEIAGSMAKLFAHKKTIAFVENADPAFVPVAVAFSEENYTIKSLTRADLDQPAAWIDPAQRELLFIVAAEDDPVTGRIHDLTALRASLKDKRIFLITVSHALHKMGPLAKPGPYEARILSLGPDRALMIGGDRCRVGPSLAQRLPWRPENDTEIAKSLAPHDPATLEKWQKAITDFEKSLPAGFSRYFDENAARVYDRAVFFHPGLDGLSLITELASQLSVSIPSIGEPAPLETTSPCRWENPRFTDWLTRGGESEEKVRGLALIAAEKLGPALTTQLAAAAAKIEKLQNG